MNDKNRLDNLEKRIETIEKRNQKVERDKAWETSITRSLCIAILTYVVVVLFFLINKVEKPYLSAIIPTVGFVLSTLTFSYIKDIWIKRNKK